MEKEKKSKSSGLPRLVRQVNLQTVTRQMRSSKLFSKIDLARQLGISTTTMTKLFAQLENEELIEKSNQLDTSFGRPKILYQLSPALQVATVIIDVELTTICFSNLNADILSEHLIEFPTEISAKKQFDRIQSEFSKHQKHLEATCHLIGVCIPGLIESTTGRSVLNPNIHWMEGTRPAEEIQKRINLPTFIMHEEMALSRAQLRTIDDTSDYITMDFSAGVGMSVVANGHHLSGTAGFAGEIGHVVMQPDGKLCGCGNRGCLETIASDRVFQSETGQTMNKALRQLANGEHRATAAAEAVLKAQATGIASVINIFNPERIFVYSRLAEAFPNYIKSLRHEAESQALRLPFKSCKIESTGAGKIKGALLQTIDRLIEQTISD